MWDAQTGQELLTLKGHTEWVRSVAFSPDGKRLASALDDTVKVWDAQTGQELLTLKGTPTVSSVAFSPDGKRLASASDGQDGEGVGCADRPGTPHPQGARRRRQRGLQPGRQTPGQRVAEDEHGEGVGCADRPGTPHPQGAQRQCHERGLQPGRQTPGLSASADKTVKVWDAQTGQEPCTLKGHTGVRRQRGLQPGRQTPGSAASADRTTTVKVWDAQTGQELLTLKGHTGAVSSVAFSPDGKRLASGIGIDEHGEGVGCPDRPGTPHLSRGTRHRVAERGLQPGRQTPGTCGRDIGIDRTREVKVWDAQTGQELLTLKGTGHVHSVAFSPDGKRLASAVVSRRRVKVWDAQTGQELLTLKGGRAAAWPSARTASAWPASLGQRSRCGMRRPARNSSPSRGTPLGQQRGLQPGRQTPGQRSDWTTTVKVWDAQTGQELLTLNGRASR